MQKINMYRWFDHDYGVTEEKIKKQYGFFILRALLLPKSLPMLRINNERHKIMLWKILSIIVLFLLIGGIAYVGLVDVDVPQRDVVIELEPSANNIE